MTFTYWQHSCPPGNAYNVNNDIQDESYYYFYALYVCFFFQDNVASVLAGTLKKVQDNRRISKM